MTVLCDICTEPQNPNDETIYTPSGGVICQKCRAKQEAYNDSFDPDEQVTLEEQIASVIDQVANDHPDFVHVTEEECGDLGRRILKLIAKELRPDLMGENALPKLRVVIEVRGGVAEVTECPEEVEVDIIDHDNEEEIKWEIGDEDA